jgi:enoyl-CoA hydratase
MAADSHSFEGIDFEVEDGIGTVTIKGGKMNSFTPAVQEDITALSDVLYEAVSDDLRVVIFRGEGDVFSSGADMSVFEEELTPQEFRMLNKTLPDFYDDIEDLEIPTVAAINGTAVGGGLELAISCDIRVASDEAKFGFPENNIGLIPGTGGCSRFVKLVGYGTAKEVILTGEIFDAEWAEDRGLVNRVVHHDEVMDEAYEVAEQIASRAPVANGLAKRVIRASVDADERTGAVLESLAQSLLVQTEDHEEGLEAFRDRRDPEFQGR